MPFSLRIIKEAASNHLDWKSLHMVDLISIIYSIRIDNALQMIRIRRQQALQKRGISDIKKASEADFDNL